MEDLLRQAAQLLHFFKIQFGVLISSPEIASCQPILPVVENMSKIGWKLVKLPLWAVLAIHRVT